MASTYSPWAPTPAHQYGRPYHNSAVFNNHVSPVQGYGFQPSTAVTTTVQEQPINRPAGRAEDRSERGQLARPVDGNRSGGNDASSTARNAIHIAKLFSSEDRNYSDNDDEGYEEFVDQYLAASRDLSLSPFERLQFLHNLFYGEALRFYNSNVAGRAREFPEALLMMKDQFKSASKQQVKAELSELSCSKFLGRSGGDERKAFKELKNHIERRLLLCPTTWRHETHKICFLRDSLVSEDWAQNTLPRVSASTSWRGLCTELGNALQIRIERDGDS